MQPRQSHVQGACMPELGPQDTNPAFCMTLRWPLHTNTDAGARTHSSRLKPLGADVEPRATEVCGALSTVSKRLMLGAQVVFLNDLETERQYRAWPRNLASLLQPMFMGGMPRVARNLFTLVFVIDPGTVEGLK